MSIVLRTALVLGALSTAPFSLQAQTTVAGFTPGSFRVTESGAAEYRIPIRVPPGIAGMEPKLALVYNSQAGNGLLGVAWNLEGLSAITRCPRTMEQDGVRGGINYDWNDRYCLDGQRLVLVSGASYGADGAEYRTERESFSKVVSYGVAGNGPAWFKVWTRSGQSVEYGNTADSRIEAQGKSSMRVWAVNKVSDTKGNYFTASYNEDNPNGDYWPNRIDFAGHSVRFVTELRPDRPLLYEAGSLVRATRRLTNVQTYYGETLLSDYRIAYQGSSATQRSRVQSISECVAGQCLPQWSFAWQEGGQGWSGADSPMPVAWNPQYVWTGDFNGDGRMDLLSLQDADASYGQKRYVMFLSNGVGGWTAPDSPMPVSWNPQYAWAGDFNGDGRTDILSLQDPDPSYGQKRYVIFFSNGNGGWTAADSPMPVSWNPQRVWLGDFNGDGRTDVLSLQEADESYGQKRYVVFFSNGTGGWTAADSPMPVAWNPQYAWTGDFNGDGKTDLVSLQDADAGYGQKRYVLFLSDGRGGWTAGDSPMPVPWNPQRVWLGDFNGDGKTDLLSLQDADTTYGQKRYVMFLSNGAFGWTAPDSPMPLPWNPQYAWTGDFNGDGKTDLVSLQGADPSYGQQRYVLFLSDGGGGWTASDSPMPLPWNPQRVWAADFNGDGKTDLVSVQEADSTYAQRRYVAFHTNAPYPDLLTSATNSLGAVTSATYKPLTDASVYAKDSGAIYPEIDVQAPLYVVSSYSTNPAGVTLTTDLRFGGAKAHALGRGALGFRWSEATLRSTGLTARTEFRQDWPYVGLPSLVRKTQSSGAVLSQTIHTPDCRNPATGAACVVAAGNRYFPFPSQSVETVNDLNGAALPTVTTATQYDLFGNAASVAVTTGDGYSKTTTNAYNADVPSWLLGRLKSSTLTSTMP